MAHGLDEDGLERQGEEIAKVNDKLEGIRVLRGAEVNILKDGTLDISNSVLKKLDVVGAAVHSHFNLSKEEQTARVISALRNPNVDILLHPTGRVLKQREAYELDMAKIMDVALEENVILEVDGFPERLDLTDEYVKSAVEKGCKICIDSDSHATSHMNFLRFGIAQARRGWARKTDVINALSLEQFLSSIS